MGVWLRNVDTQPFSCWVRGKPRLDADGCVYDYGPNEHIQVEPGAIVETIDPSRAEHLIQAGKARPAKPPPPPAPPDPLALPKLIPARERAEDEPEQEGFSYCADVDADCRASAPDQWAQYQAKLPEIPRLAEQVRRRSRSAGFVYLWSEEEVLLADFREPLETHHRERWREQHKRCFGFCIEANRREEIFPSAAPHMRFDGFTAENVQTGRHYDLVLFYDLVPGVDSEDFEKVKINKVIDRNEPELRRLHQAEIQRSPNRPGAKKLVALIMTKGKFPKSRRSLVEKCLRDRRADW